MCVCVWVCVCVYIHTRLTCSAYFWSPCLFVSSEFISIQAAPVVQQRPICAFPLLLSHLPDMRRAVGRAHLIHWDQNGEPPSPPPPPSNPPLRTLMLSKRISEWSQVHVCVNEEERLLPVPRPVRLTTHTQTHTHKHTHNSNVWEARCANGLSSKYLTNWEAVCFQKNVTETWIRYRWIFRWKWEEEHTLVADASMWDRSTEIIRILCLPLSPDTCDTFLVICDHVFIVIFIIIEAQNEGLCFKRLVSLKINIHRLWGVSAMEAWICPRSVASDTSEIWNTILEVNFKKQMHWFERLISY